MKAACYGRPACIRLLLAARADIHLRDRHGDTAFKGANSRGKYGCADLLRAAAAPTSLCS